MALGRRWLGLWRLSSSDGFAGDCGIKGNEAKNEVKSTLGPTSCAALMIQKVTSWTAGLTV